MKNDFEKKNKNKIDAPSVCRLSGLAKQQQLRRSCFKSFNDLRACPIFRAGD